jgi:hypothetical protein
VTSLGTLPSVMRSVFADSLKNGRCSLSGFAKRLDAHPQPGVMVSQREGAGLVSGQFPAPTPRADPKELTEGTVE